MSRPVHVGLVMNTIGFGGVPEVVLQIARRLPRDRFLPHVCALKGDDDANEPGQDVRRAQFEAAGVSVHYATAGPGKLDAVPAVAAWIQDRGIELLHTHSYRPNLYGRLGGALRRGQGLRIIAHYHNQYDDKWDAEPSMLALERELVASTDAMVAVSHAVRAHVSARVGVSLDRVDIVPNGVDVSPAEPVDRTSARESLGLAPSSIAIGLVGRVCEQKGQEDLVEAAVHLASSAPQAVFLMAGQIEDRALHERLRKRVGAAGLGERVRFLGHRTDMPTVYAALDIVAAPSRWEGFGLMLVEAMAAGRPIVAARAGAIPDVVQEGETALLVPPRDPVALAAALGTLIARPEQRESFGEAGRRHHRTSWDDAVGRVAEVYDRVRSAGSR